MTILERLGGDRRPVPKLSRIASDWMHRDIPVIGRDAAGVLDQVKDIRGAAADTIESLQQLAGEAAERAGNVIEQAGDEAAKATKDVRIDRNVDDLVTRLRKSLPTERIAHLVSKLERELPGTDTARYDRAYARGWARARTSFVIVGAAAGIAAGIAGAYLLDPKRGKERRDRLAAQARKASRDVSGQARRTARLTSDRARGFAVERGLIAPPDRTEEPGLEGPQASTATQAGLVGVMDPAATAPRETPAANPGTEPVMPFAEGPVTDASSTERERLSAPEGGVIGGTAPAEASVGEEPATDVTPGSGTAEAASEPDAGAGDDARLPANSSAVTSTLQPDEAEDATLTGETDDRGAWHRTL